MKVVIAIDSFKGSMGSIEAGLAAREGIYRAFSGSTLPEIVVKPLADGGEGTTQAMVEGLGGSYRQVTVTGPMGELTSARYGILADGKTAVMEMAEAAGIILVKREDLNPWKATTVGVGEMILDAVKHGCRNFIIGIGGSVTTEGGIGMLSALGFEFLDENGVPLPPAFSSLDKIASIRAAHVPAELGECRFQIACDVSNPLCGENGAVYIYGPQKGVKMEERAAMDAMMRCYACRTSEFLGTDHSAVPGTGAAGGLGFAFLSYLPNVTLRPGISIVLDAIRLEEDLRDADFVITGEGRLDGQTANGKAPVGVARLAKQHGATVLAFAGGLTLDCLPCNAAGVNAFFSIARGACSLEEAMDPDTAKENMVRSVEQVFRLIRAEREKSHRGEDV